MDLEFFGMGNGSEDEGKNGGGGKKGWILGVYKKFCLMLRVN